MDTGFFALTGTTNSKDANEIMLHMSIIRRETNTNIFVKLFYTF